MQFNQTDAILVTDDSYRDAVKREKQIAIDLAKSLAAELGVEVETAVYCAGWLERVVWSHESDVASHKASEGARRQQFEWKCRELQAERDKNSIK